MTKDTTVIDDTIALSSMYVKKIELTNKTYYIKVADCDSRIRVIQKKLNGTKKLKNKEIQNLKKELFTIRKVRSLIHAEYSSNLKLLIEEYEGKYQKLGGVSPLKLTVSSDK